MNIDWQKMNGLIPAVVQDANSGKVLMLGYMNEESLRVTQESKKITFFSRSSQKIWTKGETSGNFLNLVSIALDCDGDALLVLALPTGPTCHNGTQTCFTGPEFESKLLFLADLAKTIDQRMQEGDPSSSYVAKLKHQGLDRIAQKVGEEAVEAVIAAKNSDLENFENEAADLIFHLMVLLRAKNSSLAKVANVLKMRGSSR